VAVLRRDKADALVGRTPGRGKVAGAHDGLVPHDLGRLRDLQALEEVGGAEHVEVPVLTDEPDGVDEDLMDSLSLGVVAGELVELLGSHVGLPLNAVRRVDDDEIDALSG
jgi:hypothetical protein